MAIIKINGTALPDPSAVTWGEQDISSADAGRGANLKMYKGLKGRKVTYALEWFNPTAAQTSTILQAIDDEYFQATLWDAKAGENRTRTYYVGDRTAPVQIWTSNNKRYSKLSFTIVEQ